jgi:hypothetical protein
MTVTTENEVYSVKRREEAGGLVTSPIFLYFLQVTGCFTSSISTSESATIMQHATVRVPCKCKSRKKIQNVGKVNDTVARNMSLEAGIRERRMGGKNATEDLCEAFSAKNQLLTVQKEVSELRLVIQMMEGKMDSLLDNINRMSTDRLPSPIISRDVASTVDFVAATVHDQKVLVHESTKTEQLISKLTSDMALNTAEIRALKKVIRKKLVAFNFVYVTFQSKTLH